MGCWQLLKELEGRPTTAAGFGLEPNALPPLVEHNPSIAVEVTASPRLIIHTCI